MIKEQDPKEWVGCLCWFWNETEKFKSVGVLTGVNFVYEYPFCKNTGNCLIDYQNCRPVKKSEVKFFEENK